MIGGLGLTEPNAGSDAMGIQTTARSVDGGYVLNGTKVFITNGPIADLLVVYTKTKPETGSRGITAFIFETDTPGYHVARKLEKLGMHGSPTGELVFEDAFVPEENVLGKVNEGFKVVMSGLDLERAFFAVSMVGGLEAALEVSLKYAKEREQFGQPIANFQLIQAKLADMYTDLEAARLMAHRSMWLAQQGNLPPQLDVTFAFSQVPAGSVSAFHIALNTGASPSEATRVVVDPSTRRIGVSREQSGIHDFSNWFAATAGARRTAGRHS